MYLFFVFFTLLLELGLSFAESLLCRCIGIGFLLFQLFSELLKFFILRLHYLEQNCAVLCFSLLLCVLDSLLIRVLFFEVLYGMLWFFVGPGRLLGELELEIL